MTESHEKTTRIMGWPSNNDGTSSALRTDGFTTSSFHKTRFVNPARHTKYTPYLRTPARLSQVWVNRWTVLILLVLAHFLITIANLNTNLADAKTKALTACTKVEDIGSAMASMPHYLSRGVNSLAASGITKSVHALISILDMILKGVEALILFAIHMYTDTYVCLLSLAITGGLNATAAAITDATDGINKAIDSFANNVDKAVAPMQSVINSAWSAVESVESGINAGTSAVGGVISDITGIFGRADPSTLVLLSADPTELAKSWLSAAATASTTATAAFPRRTEALEMLAERSELVIDAIPSTVSAFRPPMPTEEALPLVTLAARVDFGDAPDISKTLAGPISSLRDFDIDSSSIVGDINALRDKVPTFDEVRNLTEQAIGIPFDYVRNALNESYGSWQFNDTVFPLAAKESLQFCSDNSTLNDFFEALFKIAATAKIVAICILCFLAVASCAWFAYLEIRRGRKEGQYVQTFETEQYDQIDFAHLFSNPRVGAFSVRIAQKIAPKPQDTKKRMLIRWCISYATSLPALFVLSLAIAGLFSCLCQVILLKSIEKQVPALAAEVGDFAEDVVYTLGNVSQRWADDANGVITSFGDDLNNDLFGHIENATEAANDTLNVLIDSMNDGLTKAFGGTFLENPVKDLVRCLIGIKIESVQKGLTWVNEHAHIDLPMFPNNVFSLGANESINGDSELTTFLASPSSVTTDEVTGAVTHVTDGLYSNIIRDALISTALLLVYIIIVVGGVLYTAFAMLTPESRQNTNNYSDIRRSGEVPRRNVTTVEAGRRSSGGSGGMHQRSSSYAAYDYAGEKKF